MLIHYTILYIYALCLINIGVTYRLVKSQLILHNYNPKVNWFPFLVENTLCNFCLPFLTGAFFFSFCDCKFDVLLILSLCSLVASCGIAPNPILSVSFPRPWSTCDVCPPARYGLQDACCSHWCWGCPAPCAAKFLCSLCGPIVRHSEHCYPVAVWQIGTYPCAPFSGIVSTYATGVTSWQLLEDLGCDKGAI